MYMSSDGPARRVTSEDVLDVFHARDDPSEPLTAPEIADVLNCSRRTALDRLHDLAASGTVASKKVGGRSRVWWLPADGEPSATLPADDPLLTGDPLIAPEDPLDETELDDALYDEADD